jgi:hypothetical protein
MMYMREARTEVPVMKVPAGIAAALVITVAATIYLGSCQAGFWITLFTPPMA